MPAIAFEDFTKIEIRVGKIMAAEPVADSRKLTKLLVDFGNSGQRQILAGIAKSYTPEQLIGKLCPFVVNLEPRKMGELESRGMMLCANNEGEPVILHPDREITPGSAIT